MRIFKFNGELEKVTDKAALIFIEGFDDHQIDFYYHKPNPDPGDKYNCMTIYDFTYCRNYKEFKQYLKDEHNINERVICRDPYTGDRYTRKDINSYLKFATYGND